MGNRKHPVTTGPTPLKRTVWRQRHQGRVCTEKSQAEAAAREQGAQPQGKPALTSNFQPPG